jgi:hypothetical protein
MKARRGGAAGAPTLANYVLLGYYDMRPVVWSSTSTSLRLTFFVTITASSTTSLRILISSLTTGRFYTVSLVSGIITSSRRSLLLRRPPPRPASDQRVPPRGGNLPALVDEKEYEVVTPQRASRITHHRLAAFISKWGME